MSHSLFSLEGYIHKSFACPSPGPYALLIGIEEVVEKGKKHKYIKRELTGKPKPKYRYWYKLPRKGLVTKDSLKVGSKFRHGKGEDQGHYDIKEVHSDGTVTIHHDETGHNERVSLSKLREMIHGGDHELGESLANKGKRLVENFQQARKTGTKKQIELRERDLKQGIPYLVAHTEEYPDQPLGFKGDVLLSDAGIREQLKGFARGGTTTFETHTSTKTKGRGADKKTYGGQRVQVKLEHMSMSDVYKKSLDQMESMSEEDKNKLFDKIAEKTGLEHSDIEPLWNSKLESLRGSVQASSEPSTGEPSRQSWKEPLVLDGKRISGVSQYAGGDEKKKGTLYITGVVRGHKVLHEGKGQVPGPKSNIKTIAKNMINGILESNKVRTYVLSPTGLITMDHGAAGESASTGGSWSEQIRNTAQKGIAINTREALGLRIVEGGLSKAKESPRTPVHEYTHRFKHGKPLASTGKPPVSREQAIAIGMSKEEGGKKVHQSKSLFALHQEEAEMYKGWTLVNIVEVNPGLTINEIEKSNGGRRPGSKYLYKKKMPSGKFRYYYKNPLGGLVSKDKLVRGAHFKVGTGPDAFDYEITHPPDEFFQQTVTVRNTTTGETLHYDLKEFQQMIHGQYRDALHERATTYISTMKQCLMYGGTPKQVQRQLNYLKKIYKGYPDIFTRDHPHPETIAEVTQAYGIDWNNWTVRALQEQPTRRPRAEVQRLRLEQSNILSDMTEAIAAGDSDALFLAQDQWRTHRMMNGALVKGFRKAIKEAREEAKRRREGNPDQQEASPAVAAFDQRDLSWIPDVQVNSLDDLEAALKDKDFIAKVVNTGITGVEPRNISVRRNIHGGGVKVDINLGHKDTRQKIGSLDLYVTKKREGLSISAGTLKVFAEYRGHDFSAQMWQRLEDGVRILSRNLPQAEKKKIHVSMFAGLDVGKYKWMTEGVRYNSSLTRREHVVSLEDALDRLEGKNFFRQLAGQYAFDLQKEDGTRPSSLEDLIGREKIEQVRQNLRQAKIIDHSIPENTIEPWHVLDYDPGVKFTAKMNNKRQPVNLMKMLALSGNGWGGRKNIASDDPIDVEGRKWAEKRRAERAAEMASRGRPWDGVPTPAGLERGLRINFSQRYPQRSL